MKRFSGSFTAIILLIALTVFTNCKSRQEAQSENSETTISQDSDSVLASIERTACFGTCPVYKMIVYESGFVIYTGRHFVDKMGTYKTRVGQKTLGRITDGADAIGYFEMEDEYVNKLVADLPSCITSVKKGDVLKTIKVNHEAPPKKLVTFQDNFDTLFEKADWILLYEHKEQNE